METVQEPEPVAPVEQQKWPTKPKDQLAAISSLLSSSTGQWTPRQLAAQFKGNITKTQPLCTESAEVIRGLKSQSLVKVQG